MIIYVRISHVGPTRNLMGKIERYAYFQVRISDFGPIKTPMGRIKFNLLFSRWDFLEWPHSKPNGENRITLCLFLRWDFRLGSHLYGLTEDNSFCNVGDCILGLTLDAKGKTQQNPYLYSYWNFQLRSHLESDQKELKIALLFRWDFVRWPTSNPMGNNVWI